jgi:hypothetical protein
MLAALCKHLIWEHSVLNLSADDASCKTQEVNMFFFFCPDATLDLVSQLKPIFSLPIILE